MRRYFILSFVLLCLFNFTAKDLFAQNAVENTHKTISYQGMVTSVATGEAITGMMPITATLFADEEGTEQIWQGSYNTQVNKGIFQLQLGAGSYPLPDVKQLDRPLWVGIRFGETETMKPLTPLSAAPYALTVADKSITANKMAADYVSGVTVDGKKITSRGTYLNLKSGPGVLMNYDETTNSLTFGSTDKIHGGQDPQWISNGSGGCTTPNADAPNPITNTIGGGCANTASGSNGTGWVSIIGGSANSATADYATLGGGVGNFATACAAFLGGGGTDCNGNFGPNTASGIASALVGGYGNTASGCAAFVGGGGTDCSGNFGPNTASGIASVVTGGYGNTASTDYSFVGAGQGNTASTSSHATVVAGNANTASGQYSFIGAGRNNVVSANDATLAGGNGNIIQPANGVTADNSAIIGGNLNEITAQYAGIGSGSANIVGLKYAFAPGMPVGGTPTTSDYSWIGGGQGNQTFQTVQLPVGFPPVPTPFTSLIGDYVSIGGGSFNSAYGTASTISGGSTNVASNSFTFVGGGRLNASSGSDASVVGGRNNSAIGQNAFLGGGYGNSAIGVDAVVSGGTGNVATGTDGTVAGGNGNIATGTNATVSGGTTNSATSTNATVSGGSTNAAGSGDATVAGGSSNTANASASTISGGTSNTITANIGDGSVIGGGANNTAVGKYAAIPGGRSATVGDYSFVFNADNSSTPNTMDVSGMAQAFVIANADVHIGNNDGVERSLRFYVPNSGSGIGSSYVGFKAPASLTNTSTIMYTLPGKLPQNNGAFLTSSTSGNLLWEDIVTVPHGGIGLTAYTAGDMLYASSTNSLSTISLGNNMEVLTVVNGVPQWAPASAGSQWTLTGNPGTNPGTGSGQNYLGTSDATAFIIATNATPRITIGASSGVTVNTSIVAESTIDLKGAITNSGSINSGALFVNDAMSVAGTLDAQGNIFSTTGPVTIADGLTVSGTNATSLGGTLSVTGATTLSGALDVRGNITNGTGDVTIADALNITGNIANSSGAVTIADALTVSGSNATSLGGSLSVTGTSTLTGNTTVGGTFGVTGVSTLSGATSISNTLTVSGNNATTLGGTLTVTGATTLSSTLAVTGNITTTSRIGAGITSPEVSLDVKGALALRKNGRDGGTSHITDLVHDITNHSNWFVLNVGDTSYFRLTDGANDYGRRVILTGARQAGQIVIIENADEDWTPTNRRGFYIQQQHNLTSSTFETIDELFGENVHHLNLKYRTIIALIYNGSAWVELFRRINVPQIDSPDDVDDPD